MEKEVKLLICFIVCIMVFFVATVFHIGLTQKNETIIGRVTDIIFSDDFMTICFNNDSVFNINYLKLSYDGILDLTVNSNMRIELRKVNPWHMPNIDNRWDIISIVKYPEGDK